LNIGEFSLSPKILQVDLAHLRSMQPVQTDQTDRWSLSIEISALAGWSFIHYQFFVGRGDHGGLDSERLPGTF
jgi:hypothetical protein